MGPYHHHLNNLFIINWKYIINKECNIIFNNNKPPNASGVSNSITFGSFAISCGLKPSLFFAIISALCARSNSITFGFALPAAC